MKSKISGLIAVLSVIAFWEISVRVGVVQNAYLPPPSKIVPTIRDLIADGTLIDHSRATLERIAVGFSLSVVVGVIAGLICAMWAPAMWTFGTVVETMRAIPALALLPVFMLFFGIGFTFPVAVVFWVAWIPIFLNTIYGVRNVDREVIDAARVDGASEFQLTRRIILPLAAPAVFTGMRLAMGNAFVVIVVAEMIGSTTGLGYYIFDSMQTFRISEMYATIVFLGLIAWAVNELMTRLSPLFVRG